MLNPYLFYDGNCEAALKFYERTLGGKIEMLLRAEEAPADMPPQPGWAGPGNSACPLFRYWC